MLKKAPLVFMPNGGMSIETKQFYMRLSQLLCEKLDVSYSDASAWVKQEAGLSLHRISIICIIASRSKKYIIPRFKGKWLLNGSSY